jgi:hypothetical protein
MDHMLEPQLGVKKGTFASLRQRYHPGARVSPSALVLEVLHTMADRLGLPLTAAMVEALVEVESEAAQASEERVKIAPGGPVFGDQER